MNDTPLAMACCRGLRKMALPSDVALLVVSFWESSHRAQFEEKLLSELDVATAALVMQVSYVVRSLCQSHSESARFIDPFTSVNCVQSSAFVVLFQLPEALLQEYLIKAVTSSPFLPDDLDRCPVGGCTGRFNEGGVCYVCRAPAPKGLRINVVGLQVRNTLCSQGTLLQRAVQILKEARSSSSPPTDTIRRQLKKHTLSLRIEVCRNEQVMRLHVSEHILSRNTLVTQGTHVLLNKLQELSA
eukprot:TRINITY_DN63696_c0_g1_i1.p1 TRINITY_DN63696_c0_g1~~TRINITY_DN63696_c0_g1_i1.p1  ORF type:complete len:266 (+),score=100.53 TRINITY_DN63696_c0_g1_i1:70-798(+)